MALELLLPRCGPPSPEEKAINAPKVHITYPKGTYHAHKVSISREQRCIYYPWALRYAFAHISLRVTRGQLTPSTVKRSPSLKREARLLTVFSSLTLKEKARFFFTHLEREANKCAIGSLPIHYSLFIIHHSSFIIH